MQRQNIARHWNFHFFAQRLHCNSLVSLLSIRSKTWSSFLSSLAELAQKFKCILKWFYETELQAIYLYLNKHPKWLPTKHSNIFLVNSQQTPYLIPPHISQYHQYLSLLQSCPWISTSMNIRISSSLYINNITRSWHFKMSSNSEVHKLD